MFEGLMSFLVNFWEITLELAPWLLFGLVAAGLIKTLVPMDIVGRLLGRKGILSAFYAAVVGVPLPLCSCSVLPVAIGLKRQGASRSAFSSFMISTPQTGVDSLAVSWGLLGPFMTIVRPIVAVISALVTGVVVGMLPATRKEAESGAAEDQSAMQGGSCCGGSAKKESAGTEVAGSCCSSGSGGGISLSVMNQPDENVSLQQADSPSEQAGASCCSSEPANGAREQGFIMRLIDGQYFAMKTLLGDLLKWLIIGLVAAAVVDSFAPEAFLKEWGTGLTGMLIMLVVGIPMYICATSSTPLAASLLAAGVSPGAVIVFLLAGPATNVSTFGIIRREMDTRAAIVFLLVLCASAVLLGLGVDWVWQVFDVNVIAQVAHVHEHGGFNWIGLAGLLALIAGGIWVRLPKRDEPKTDAGQMAHAHG